MESLVVEGNQWALVAEGNQWALVAEGNQELAGLEVGLV